MDLRLVGGHGASQGRCQLVLCDGSVYNLAMLLRSEGVIARLLLPSGGGGGGGGGGGLALFSLLLTVCV